MKFNRKSTLAIAVLIGFASQAGTGCSSSRSKSAGQIVASGRFHQVTHRGTGRAAIHQLPERKFVLRLTEFRTDYGRDLEILLVAAADALENEIVENSERISLGQLESAEGDQSYPLPDNFDFTKYRAVTIWSRKHKVNFTTAPLTVF